MASLRILGPGLVLTAVHLVTFGRHYSGVYVFPWDFLGGYHFESFGWFDQQGLFDSPVWFPWGNLGFPAALSVQSGAWYLPRAALGLLGRPYTVEMAAALQSAHVLLGAMGVYALLRQLGGSRQAALFGAICYHFSAGFYSNQQHVDIVRAYALLPWLLWSIHPDWLLSRRWAMLVSAGIIQQFLVAAYPGNIATALYACMPYCLVLLLSQRGGRKRLHYTGALTVLAVSAVCMAQIKWLPFLSTELFETGGGLAGRTRFGPTHLLTLLLSHDMAFLPGSLTMRSLFLPSGFLAALFVRRRTQLAVLGACLLGSALLCGGIAEAAIGVPLPALSLSRFPLSDWRAVFQLGLIFLAVQGVTDVVSSAPSLRHLLRRCLVLLALGLLFAWVAVSIGYSRESLLRPLQYGSAIAACIAAYMATKHRFARSAKVAGGILVAVLLLASLVDGLSYHRKFGRGAWQKPWDEGIEKRAFGVAIAEAAEKARAEPPVRRPARVARRGPEGNILLDHRARLHSFYAQCWYSRTYCLFGYSNIGRFSIPHKKLFGSFGDDGAGRGVLDFMMRPQQVLVGPTSDELKLEAFPASESAFVSLVENASVEPISYGPETVRYEVSAPVALRVMENEIWWKGWKLRLCNEQGCLDSQETFPSEIYLRSWLVPRGKWTAELHFEEAGRALSRYFFLFGLFLVTVWVAYGSLSRFCRRMKHADMPEGCQ